MSVNPLRDYVLVEPSPVEDTTPGGILLPENSLPKPKTGKVIAVGIGRMVEGIGIVPMSVKVGDVVFIYPYQGLPVSDDGKDLLLIRESELIAVLK